MFYLLEASNHFLDCNYDDGNWNVSTAKLCLWESSDPHYGHKFTKHPYYPGGDFKLTLDGFNEDYEDLDLIKSRHFEGSKLHKFKGSTNTQSA